MRLALWLALGFGVGIGIWSLGQLESTYSEPQSSLCILRRAGIPCPNCGMTRALGALARGDVLAAHRLHPLAIVLLVEGVVVWLIAGVQLVQRRPWTLPDSQTLTRWLGAHAVALVALWLGRAATGTLPW